MGEALFELEQAIRSKSEKMTSQEANLLMTCKANAIREFTFGVGAGAGITWLATRRLSNILRISFSGGSAIFFGLWRFGRSLESCVQHILSADGSRMQKELASILLQKHPDDQNIMQLISKKFYPEKVYDDSSSDQPRLMWRYRNFFKDTVVQPRRMDDGDSYHEKRETDETMVNPNTASVSSVSSSFDIMLNPLDCVFGAPTQAEEIYQSDSSSKMCKGHSRRRRHKRFHYRHHRMRDQEGRSSTEDL